MSASERDLYNHHMVYSNNMACTIQFPDQNSVVDLTGYSVEVVLSINTVFLESTRALYLQFMFGGLEADLW